MNSQVNMNYYIGMFDNYDDKKYKRDYKSHFSGIEFCNLENMNEVSKVFKSALKDKIKIGIHFPLLKTSYKYRDAQITTPDELEFNMSMEAIEKEIKLAKDLQASYLLVHFPKPMVLNFNYNWSIAKFGEEDTLNEDELDYESFYQLCDRAMYALAVLSLKYQINIVLELELFNEWLYKTDLLIELLGKYPALKLCMDSARLHVIESVLVDFEMIPFIKKHSKYITNIHLANIHVEKEVSFGHHPPLKHLNKKGGWCNLEAFLQSLDHSKKLNILYEHQSSRISDSELNECYKWVESTLEGDINES